MPASFSHPRILSFPVDLPPSDGLLQGYTLEQRRGATDLLLHYHALQPCHPAELFEREGRAWEWVKGHYVPRRLRFHDVNLHQGESIPESLAGLHPEHPDRRLYSAFGWRSLEGERFALIDLYRQLDDTLLLTARSCTQEPAEGPSWETELEREWSPTPLCEEKLIPVPWKLWRRFGGNPVRVQVRGQMEPLRLFVGGLEMQNEQRPRVQAVLNLGERPSRWCEDEPFAAERWPMDKWLEKGEGARGMSAQVLGDIAGWVIERLERGEQVLVHCSAGMNRSASVGCAVVILLEHVTAEAALERLRERHPWAKPDPRHWLALRWLAKQVQTGRLN